MQNTASKMYDMYRQVKRKNRTPTRWVLKPETAKRLRREWLNAVDYDTFTSDFVIDVPSVDEIFEVPVTIDPQASQDYVLEWGC